MSVLKVPFNKPFMCGKEIEYILDAVKRGHISGNGFYTRTCQSFLEARYGFSKCLLTTSCTDALEMCALLLDIEQGDEVIMPSYTFVSTALAFVRQGAKIVFVDSRPDHPGIDENLLEDLITPRTKAIIPVHYAGVACDMDKIMEIANRHNLIVVEEAAQAIDSYYRNRPLGSIGHLATFSFHETKNIQCGEGGLLVINDERFYERAEIIWEKGTNRSKFFRGEIDKYSWVDLGSSFLPSDLLAAFLYGQLEQIASIQDKRIKVWNWYNENLNSWLPGFHLVRPEIPEYASNNAHMFYAICDSLEDRTRLIRVLRERGIHAVFHYLALHRSPFYVEKEGNENVRELKHCDRYANTLVRFPLYCDLDVDLLSGLS